jgi:hypothetical protein
MSHIIGLAQWVSHAASLPSQQDGPQILEGVLSEWSLCSPCVHVGLLRVTDVFFFYTEPSGKLSLETVWKRAYIHQIVDRGLDQHCLTLDPVVPL